MIYRNSLVSEPAVQMFRYLEVLLYLNVKSFTYFNSAVASDEQVRCKSHMPTVYKKKKKRNLFLVHYLNSVQNTWQSQFISVNDIDEFVTDHLLKIFTPRWWELLFDKIVVCAHYQNRGVGGSCLKEDKTIKLWEIKKPNDPHPENCPQLV